MVLLCDSLEEAVFRPSPGIGSLANETLFQEVIMNNTQANNHIAAFAARFWLLPARFLLLTACFLLPVSAFANSAPVVGNLTVSQRTDGSKKVDIRYNLSDADGDRCTVSVQVSADDGATWTVPAVSFSGAIGTRVAPGTGKLITWDCAADLPGAYGTNYRVKIIADDGVVDGPGGMVWVYINDPGVSGHEGFNGYMSKYETTNAQYCQYLNAALASGDIRVSGNIVYGNSGEYNGQVYFHTYGYTS